MALQPVGRGSFRVFPQRPVHRLCQSGPLCWEEFLPLPQSPCAQHTMARPLCPAPQSL